MAATLVAITATAHTQTQTVRLYLEALDDRGPVEGLAPGDVAIFDRGATRTITQLVRADATPAIAGLCWSSSRATARKAAASSIPKSSPRSATGGDLTNRLAAMAQDIVADFDRTSTQYRLEYATESAQPAPDLKVSLLRDGVKMRMSRAGRIRD